jgi:tRNA threonylcarbamoyl adenosine modification protein YjeE
MGPSWNLVRSWDHVTLANLEQHQSELLFQLHFPALIFLEGEIGTGKTTWIKRFLPNSKINSPTYSLLDEGDDYLHGDFYRLKSSLEISDLELELYSEKKMIFLEWGFSHQNFLTEIFQHYNWYTVFLSSPDFSHRKIQLWSKKETDQQR